jgi:hypothetical protein
LAVAPIVLINLPMKWPLAIQTELLTWQTSISTSDPSILIITVCPQVVSRAAYLVWQTNSRKFENGRTP